MSYMQNLRKATLAFLVKGDKILLAMKKEGFGQGKWNGVGGKVKEREGETVEQALIRETREEINIKPLNYEQKAILKFFFPKAPKDKDWNQKVYVFLIKEWEGEPKETEEMKPQWTSISQIPYRKMWADDFHWLPEILKDKNVEGEFTFNNKGEIINHSLKIL